MKFWSTFSDIWGNVGSHPWSLGYWQESIVWTLVNVSDGRELADNVVQKKFLNMHKSSHWYMY